MNIIISSFRQSFKSCPIVFKAISLYFGFYFIAFAAILLFTVSYFFSTEIISTRRALNALAAIALVFIVPYYTYKYSKNTDIQPFWLFIRKTFWPVVWNFYIKAIFIVSFFSFLLIIPGLYKLARLFFVNETIFFDNLYKKKQISALKGSDRTSQGYFWPILLVSTLVVGGIFFAEFLAPFLMKKYLFISLFGSQTLIFIIKFYIICFLSLFYTQLYFEIKKRKEEHISC